MLPFLLTFRQLWRALRYAMRDPGFQALATMTSSLLALGTLFYHRVERWSWLDSFYFCAITLTTVGYGDFSPQTAAGKLFTIGYILLGIGLLIAIVERLADALLATRRESRPAAQLRRLRRGVARRRAARRADDAGPD